MGERDLARVDRPLAFVTERRSPFCPGNVAFGIIEIAERTIDGPESISAARHHPTRLNFQPQIDFHHAVAWDPEKVGGMSGISQHRRKQPLSP